MIVRLLLVIALFALGFALYFYTTRRQVGRLAAMNPGSDPILRRLEPGIPAIVYFTTPDCIPCRTQQQPALAQLTRTLGSEGVQIIKIDATQDPESADRWGVFSAPTTFIIDRHGKTRAVNHGVANADKLRRQLDMA
jgi:thiol-disulfide isomerase/thioredoxin